MRLSTALQNRLKERSNYWKTNVTSVKTIPNLEPSKIKTSSSIAETPTTREKTPLYLFQGEKPMKYCTNSFSSKSKR